MDSISLNKYYAQLERSILDFKAFLKVSSPSLFYKIESDTFCSYIRSLQTFLRFQTKPKSYMFTKDILNKFDRLLRFDPYNFRDIVADSYISELF